MAGKRRYDPPTLSDDVDYDDWEREIKIWQMATDVDKSKQGASIYLSLEGKARESCKTIDPKDLEGEEGVKVLLEKLKKLYGKDDAQVLFQIIENFETYQRPAECGITDFLNEWEKRYDKCVQKKTTWEDNVLGYKLLKAANLDPDKQVLVRATISSLKVDDVKKQIRAVFDRTVNGQLSNIDNSAYVKVEPTFYGENYEPEEVYFSDNGMFSRGRGRRRGGRSFSQNRRGRSSSRGSPSSRGSSPFRGNRSNSAPGPSRDSEQHRDYKYQQTERKRLNPPDRTGAPSRCAICGSVMHYAVECQHNEKGNPGEEIVPTMLAVEVGDEDPFERPHLLQESKTSANEEYIPSLFTNNTPERYKDCFTGEALHSAILDSGCRKSVCGKLWYECFLEALTTDLLGEVEEVKSVTKFRFGDGPTVCSIKSSRIPGCINGVRVRIQIEVIDNEIPLLLSKEAMKKAGTVLYFETDSVSMFGKKFPLDFTSSGHYMIHVHPSVMKVPRNNPLLLLNISNMNNDEKRKAAIKLHKQFGHADSIRIIDLIKDAGMTDSELSQLIKEVQENCETCNSFKRTALKPVVGFALAKEFNETVCMDLKDVTEHKVFHMIDTATRYSAGAIIKNKTKETIIEKFFTHWIALFGCPGTLLSDNGGEFNNDLMRELGEQLNTDVKSTAGESPWSNGITERHNALIGQMMNKILNEQKCAPEIALAWSLSAKNALKNVYGFSPNQLVFGHNPNLPSVTNSELPALSGVTPSELIATHLNTMHAARKAFVECEASDKLRRALLSKTRTATVKDYHNGTSVLYKREKDVKWHGPAVVLGVDNKCVIIKHQGQIYRVSPCHLQLHRTMVDESAQVVRSNSITQLCDEPQQQQQQQKQQKQQQQNVSSVNNAASELSEDEDEYSTIMGLSKTNQQLDDSLNETNDAISSPTASSCEPTNDFISSPTSSTIDSDASMTSVLSNPTVASGEIPRKDSKIIYKLHDSDTIRNATVIGRGGTARGLNKYYMNIQNEDKSLSGLDVSKVEGWKYANGIFLLSDLSTNEILAAKIKELDNLMSHDAVTVVDDVGQETIDSRWIVTEKYKDGSRVVKARLVAKGFQEKCNTELRKDSPTILKVNLRLIACISSCRGWAVKSLDIRSAFLQGEILERDVFLKPPVEAGLEHQLWKLRKALYGLGDASRKWYLKVKNILLSLGVQMSVFDEALFYFQVNGGLEGLMGVHVDDFFHAGTRLFDAKIIRVLKETFEISQEDEMYFDYVGLEIEQCSDTIVFHQEKYISDLTCINFKNKPHKNDPLSPQKVKELRSLVGQLAWASNQTRPDISFDVCQLSVNINNATYAEAVRANKCVKKLKNDLVSIKFPLLGEIRRCQFVVYADASFKNLAGGGSQGGYVVFIRGSNGKQSLLAWQSRKLKRVVKSTLAAETLALMEGVECAFLCKTTLKELLGIDADIPIQAYSDSKSLVDSVHSSKTLEDNRLKIDICVLRDYLRLGEVKQIEWVDTKEQLADVLTKSGASAQNLLDVLSQ